MSRPAPTMQDGRDETASGKGLLQRLRRIIADRRGVGAIEFAIVAPLLIMTYVGAFEITVAVTMSRKVARASANVSDLLTRSDSTNLASLNAMKDVTRSVLSPFSQDVYNLKMTGITVDDTGKATIAWSRAWSRTVSEGAESASTPYAKGASVKLPDDVVAKGSFIVRTEFAVKHRILLLAPGLSSQLNTITLSKTSYFRHRKGDKVMCSDC